MQNKKARFVFNIILIVLGCFFLAGGTGIFLTPGNIVAGGVSGLAIIINYFINKVVDFYAVDIIVWSLNVILFIIGLIFLGKKFMLGTLLATLLYPAFLTMFVRVPFFIELGNNFVTSTFDAGLSLIAGLFGGLAVGVGCGLTFLGEGSTGGLDVLCFIFAKKFHIKQSISSFVLDATVIILGLCLGVNKFIPALIGVLTAVVAALMIHVVYISFTSALLAEIITDKYVEINDYVINVLERTTTLVDVEGGFTGKKKKMIKFVFDKREYIFFKDKVAEIDPDAFMTISTTKAVLGEGFSLLKPTNSAYRKIMEKPDKKK